MTDFTSFVVKKKGLIASTKKYGNAAGEGVAYLKSWLWWTGETIRILLEAELICTGMIMMIVGEICNFAA